MQVIVEARPAPASPGPIREEYAPATRVHTSILAPLEKRCLIWLATRMPRAVNSDHLTGLALVAMLGVGGSFWLARLTPIGLLLAVVCLALNWFGDSLDGTLARVRAQERPRYGFYVDHVVDAFGTLFLFTGLALSGYMSPYVALGLLVVYFMLCIEIFLATHALGTFTMSYFKVGPTELRILLAIGALALLFDPKPVVFGTPVRLFDLGGVLGAAGLFITLILSAARHTRALYRAEPLRPSPKA